MDTQVLTALEIKEEGKNKTIDAINTSYIRGVNKSTLTCQDIHLFHRPDKTLFIIPCCVGTAGNVQLSVNVFDFNSESNSWLNLSHLTFNITDSDGSTTLLPLGTASFMRMNDIKKAELKLFVKFYSSKGPRKAALRTSLLSASLLYDETKNEVSWDHVSEGVYLTLPVWIDSGELFEPKPNGSTAQLSSCALKTDLLGDSITLGGPKLVPSLTFGQVFALYQSAPFEVNINVTHPQMTISFNSSGQESNDVTTHANVINNINESLTIGVWGQSLNAHFNNTWSQAKVAHLGLSSISDLNTAINISQDDIVHLTTNAYNIWIYPIYQKSKSENVVSEVSIIKPIRENITTFIPTNNPDFFYDQDYESGMLLSYVNASKKGLKDSNLLFHPVSLPILGDRSSTSSISYMESNTTLQSDSITKDVTIGAGGSLTLNAQFSSLFSINNTLSFNHTETSGNTSTSSSTLTKGFHISFNFGNVKDDVYQFQVTPLVYHQEKTNLLLIKYDVELTGSKWHDYFSTPKPVLFRIFPFSEDILSHSYTRSIRFTPISEEGNEATLSIMIFNNSLNPLSNLTCRVYDGLPKLDQENQMTTNDLVLIKEVDNLSIDAAISTFVECHDVIIKKESFVTVELVHDSLLFKNQKIYWSSYPYNKSSQILLLT
ncbi:hypothetical protein [Photobacterium leiognathi]|uniref:hypothetical protein n=1 Tax=Photobacterium leiognathi TaxID=553611 RepID=UPI0027390BC4|nr:hypothetical protein [Photobacterium leiognathi]